MEHPPYTAETFTTTHQRLRVKHVVNLITRGESRIVGSYFVIRDAVKDLRDLRGILDRDGYGVCVGHTVSGQCCL